TMNNDMKEIIKERGLAEDTIIKHLDEIRKKYPQTDFSKIKPQEDIIQAVAARYLEIGCSVMTPNSKRVEMLKGLVKSYHADGVIEVDLQACAPYAVEAFSVRKLMAEANMPYMVLETDYGQTDSGQISTRIEAFMEML
ncbi:MAG: hypothetical protein EOM17_11815, partial [Synergistales bacterium]|nr:hypothetical protein [Synergistales bacterium]